MFVCSDFPPPDTFYFDLHKQTICNHFVSKSNKTIEKPHCSRRHNNHSIGSCLRGFHSTAIPSPSATILSGPKTAFAPESKFYCVDCLWWVSHNHGRDCKLLHIQTLPVSIEKDGNEGRADFSHTESININIEGINVSLQIMKGQLRV